MSSATRCRSSGVPISDNSSSLLESCATRSAARTWPGLGTASPPHQVSQVLTLSIGHFSDWTTLYAWGLRGSARAPSKTDLIELHQARIRRRQVAYSHSR